MALDGVNLVYAFTAGMLATINPCGWAMLPSFVSYYLGTKQEGYAERPLSKRLLEGLFLGALVTAGFLVIFGTTGVVVTAGIRAIVRWMPLAALAVGIGLVGLGVWLFSGRSLPLSLPNLEMGVRGRSPKAVFAFGLAYGFASLSCTLPVFLAVVGASLALGSATGSALMFAGYAAGMGAVLTAVALSAALLKGALTDWLKSLLPYTYRLSAILLILAGLYLIWFQGRYLPVILAGL